MKNALLYIFAVGGSVLAIVGLLYLGQELKAPVSVGGAWKVQLASPCETVPRAAEEPGLRISQSGPNLEIQLDDAKGTLLHGQIEGSRVVAETRGASADVRLQAEVEKSGGEARMQGTLDVEGCEGAIPVHAIRQQAAAGGSRGH